MYLYPYHIESTMSWLANLFSSQATKQAVAERAQSERQANIYKSLADEAREEIAILHASYLETTMALADQGEELIKGEGERSTTNKALIDTRLQRFEEAHFVNLGFWLNKANEYAALETKHLKTLAELAVV